MTWWVRDWLSLVGTDGLPSGLPSLSWARAAAVLFGFISFTWQLWWSVIYRAAGVVQAAVISSVSVLSVTPSCH